MLLDLAIDIIQKNHNDILSKNINKYCIELTDDNLRLIAEAFAFCIALIAFNNDTEKFQEIVKRSLKDEEVKNWLGSYLFTYDVSQPGNQHKYFYLIYDIMKQNYPSFYLFSGNYASYINKQLGHDSPTK